MHIEKFIVGSLGTNCYIIEGDRKEAMVIDPGYQEERLLDYIKHNKLDVKYIVNTHGHVDHIGGNFDVHELTGAPICINKQDESYLGKDPLSYIRYNRHFKNSTADRYLSEGDTLEFGGLTAKIYETPGHSKGGICVHIENHLFVGDTLFNGSIGRTDLADGDFDALISSIKSKILVLPDDTIVHPGHMGDTTVGKERQFNPFL